MHMVRHHHKCVQHNTDEMLWNCALTFKHNFTRFVQHHLVVDDLTEEALASLRTDGDEVRTRLRIVIARQPDRTALMCLDRMA